MASRFGPARRRRRNQRNQRFATRDHQIREREQRRQRAGATAEQPAIEPHEPPHSTGCLRCFVARGDQSTGSQA